MGIAGSPDIFQAKIELMATLEFVRTYLDDLLCITKGNLADHLDKLIARRRLESQRRQIEILCSRNRVFRVYPNKGWDKTSDEQNTSDTCIKITNKC